MKKRILKTTALLSTIAFAGVLVACSNGSQNSDSGSKELTVYVEEQYKPYIEEAAQTFEKESGTKVNIKTGDQLTGLDNLSLDNQSGEVVDVMMAPYDRVGSLGNDGQLAEVELAEESMTDDTTKKLVTAADGNVYGAPAVIETLVLYYNKDLIQEAPKTFEEVEKLAEDPAYNFEGEEGKNTAFLADWVNFYYAYGLLGGNGGYVFGKDGTDAKDIGLANDGSIKGLEYAKTWYEKWPKGMQDQKGAANLIESQFQEKKTAAVIDGPWKAAAYKDAGINYGVATIPTLLDGANYEAFAGGKAWVIPVASKNIDGAQEFLNFLTSTDQQKAFYDKNHEVPANTEARKYAVDSKDELANAVVKQFDSAQPMPSISEMSTVWDPAATMLFEAVSGKKAPKAAADDAVKLIKDSIDQKFGE